jgi:hypothetical protein
MMPDATTHDSFALVLTMTVHHQAPTRRPHNPSSFQCLFLLASYTDHSYRDRFD